MDQEKFNEFWASADGADALKGASASEVARAAFLRGWEERKRQANAAAYGDAQAIEALMASGGAAALLSALAKIGGAEGALGEAGALFQRKGEDYNAGFKRDDYFPMGLPSYAQMIWVKSLRVLSFAKQPRDENFEKVRDTLLDLINYAAFCADWLKRQRPAQPIDIDGLRYGVAGGVGYPNYGGGSGGNVEGYSGAWRPK